MTKSLVILTIEKYQLNGYNNLAQVHEMRNEFEKAINDYKRLIENLKDDYGVTDGEQVDRYVREIA